ncbi:MAG TPA: helix-turn-helix domain-containing protein [Candidatus Borkfalkia excrementipullorum]|nr:helix-turn-helix domain-containing protein [Candidatus Borkfalkia excrementipullorum]
MLQEFIAEEFTKARKAMGISQRELAQRCGLPQSTVGRIEAGLVVPNLLTLAKIAEVLQLEISVRPKERRGTV